MTVKSFNYSFELSSHEGGGGGVSESGFEAMLEGLSWAEQMELEEQLAEAQGRRPI